VPHVHVHISTRSYAHQCQGMTAEVYVQNAHRHFSSFLALLLQTRKSLRMLLPIMNCKVESTTKACPMQAGVAMHKGSPFSELRTVRAVRRVLTNPRKTLYSECLEFKWFPSTGRMRPHSSFDPTEADSLAMSQHS
jgi:hypothetical protein